MRFAYINNSFVQEDKAVIGVNDLAIRRGFGIFDFFRSVGLTPLFIDNHLDRLYFSAKNVGLTVPVDKKELKKICVELIKKNNIKDSGIRIVLTGGYSPNGYTPAAPNLIITNEPLKLVDEETRSRGVSVISYNYQREFPEVKTINYFSGIMLQQQADKAGHFDVLYHDDGKVREFTRSNIFIITQDQKVVTPVDKLLKGITRRYVLELAEKKYKVEERSITMDEVLTAEEVFMTGTTKRVLPIVKIDDQTIGDGKPGPVTMDLYDKFYEFEQQQLRIS